MVPLATEMEIRFWHGNRTEQSVAVSSVTGSLGKRDWNMFDTRQQSVAVNSVYTFAWPVKLEYVSHERAVDTSSQFRLHVRLASETGILLTRRESSRYIYKQAIPFTRSLGQ